MSDPSIESGEDEKRRIGRRDITRNIDVDVDINVSDFGLVNIDEINVDDINVEIWVPEAGSIPEPPDFDDGSAYTAEEQRVNEEAVAASQEPQPEPG